MDTERTERTRKGKRMPTHQNVERVALSVVEAAQAAGVSRSYIYEALSAPEADGGLKSVRLGRRRMIRPADLEAWVSRSPVAA